MTRQALLTRALAVTAGATLAVGLATGPVAASPDAAAKTLAGMKYSWTLKSHAVQVAQCRIYVANRSLAINSAVQAIAVLPRTSGKLTPAETRSVATKYLRWACSGPGHTPR
jgi:energy-converting hydrogenase Eha subunit B